MQGKIQEFLRCCETVDFGKTELSERGRDFYLKLGHEMVSLCRAVPESVQTDSMLFLLQYSGLRLGDKLDFFANYYPPVWSILYRLSH